MTGFPSSSPSPTGWQVVRDSGHILLEGTPAGLDPREIGESLRETFPSVVEVHHVHAWSITKERPVMTLHDRV
jgi:cobalt-zinc-cadmium efflux system protein